MRDRLEQRVSELKAEQEKGQRALAEIDARQAELRQTLLRISGAIQVLEELLTAEPPQSGSAPAADGTMSPADGLVPAAAH